MFSFVKNRPPLVVFFICIFTLAVTISCFAYYIKNTESVPDSDRNHDWVVLLRHFNTLDACLKPSGDIVDKRRDDGNFIETTTVQTLISINNTEIIRKLTSVRGFLTLDNWHTDCPKNNPKPGSLQIYFDVPKILNANVSKYDICATIEGPEEYLPKFSVPNCNVSVGEASKKATFMSTSVKAIGDNEFCKGGSLIKLDFYSQTKDNLANFLSDSEKGAIYFHLLWTSYVLMFLLVLIVIYGTFHSDFFYDSVLHKWIPFHKQ